MRGYPLRTPLRLRALAEDEARTALAGAAVREAEARAGLERRTAAAGAAAERLRGGGEALAAAGDGPAGSLAAGARFVRRLRAERAALQESVRAAEAEVVAACEDADARRDGLAAARAEREGLERHRAAWSAERRREGLRRAQAEADDGLSARRAGR